MRSRLPLFLSLALFSVPSFALDVVLPIAGSVNVFRTDARILNPSFEEDIVVRAWFLPAGNVANGLALPASVELTIGKRQMRVFDDVVLSIFNATGLGAIYLVSEDEFIASSRIYAQTEEGTLGQFVPGMPLNDAQFKGSLMQLKSNADFRTNIGFVAPGNFTANVTLTLHDAQGGLTTAPLPEPLNPYGVMSPTNITSLFPTAGKDLTDAWISFTSDNPVMAYASVVDNHTTDPTFIPMTADLGVPPVGPPTKTFTITARQWNFDIAEAAQIRVKRGDRVVLNITSRDVVHGISIERYAPSPKLLLNNQSVTIEFTADTAGTFQYFCTESGCGTGHISMADEIIVEP